jgi:integrase
LSYGRKLPIYVDFFTVPFTVSAMQPQNAAKTPTWKPTRLQNLLRHKSGRYYARAYVGGKEIWQSLGTSLFSVAEVKLAEFLKQYRSVRRQSKNIASAKMTFKQATEIHLQNLDCKIDIKQRTRDYWRETLKALRKSWPELDEMQLRSVTESDLKQWAKRYSESASVTRYNNTVHLFRHILQVGVDQGVLAYNFADKLERKKVVAKNPPLPTLAQFSSLLDAMWNGHGRYSKACADLTAGLAFTGCRLREARWLTWSDIDFDAGRITIRGNPVTGTKSGEERTVRLLPDAAARFERMRRDFSDDESGDKVFRVGECQKAMNRAMKQIGMKRITHHDLRHFFATRCIESGVDIPTVAYWLGHRDRGVTLMKRYGHLRDEHAAAAAQRVSFSTPKPADNVIQLSAVAQ